MLDFGRVAEMVESGRTDGFHSGDQKLLMKLVSFDLRQLDRFGEAARHAMRELFSVGTFVEKHVRLYEQMRA